MMDMRESSCDDVWTPRPGSWEETVYTYEEQCANLRFAPTCNVENKPMYRQREDQWNEVKEAISA